MARRKRNRPDASRRGWIAGALGGAFLTSLPRRGLAAASDSLRNVATIGTSAHPGELRTLSGAKSGDHLVALGFWAPGDGGGGLFEWAIGASKDDGGLSIVPKASTGHWRRLFSGAIDVRWFGARGSGHDDHDAIQQAIGASASRAVCWLPAGTYVVGHLKLPSGLTLVGEDRNGTVLRLRAGNYGPATDGDGGAILGNIDMLAGNRDIHIRRLTLDGDHESSTGGCHGIELKANKGGQVEDCSVEDCVIRRMPHQEHEPFVAGHGIRLWNATRCTIRGCNIEDNLGDGVNIYFGSSHVVIESCTFRRNAFLGIDCEGRTEHDWTSARNRDIAIRNSTFSENNASAIGVYATDAWQVTGNSIFEGGGSGTRNGVTIIGASAGVIAANMIAELQGAAVHIGVDDPKLHGVPGTDCTDIMVAGNTVSACQVGVRLFNRPGSHVSDIAVNANTIRKTKESALQIEGASERVVFNGNVVSGTGAAAIKADVAVPDLSMSSNTFHEVRGETLAIPRKRSEGKR